MNIQLYEFVFSKNTKTFHLILELTLPYMFSENIFVYFIFILEDLDQRLHLISNPTFGQVRHQRYQSKDCSY